MISYDFIPTLFPNIQFIRENHCLTDRRTLKRLLNYGLLAVLVKFPHCLDALDLKVSIIIPTLNETIALEKTLVEILRLKPHEIIICDGGSVDDTVAIAKKHNCRMVTSAPGRALQMNAAARMAGGAILVFLHADSFIKTQGYNNMINIMQKQDIVGGAFSLGIDSDIMPLKIIARLATWRSKYLHLVYGDQAIFVRTSTFNEIGGFSLLPICEDLDFFRKLRKAGNTLILDEKTLTSPRRWASEGFIFTTLRNIAIAGLFLLGFSPKVLSRWYASVR